MNKKICYLTTFFVPKLSNIIYYCLSEKRHKYVSSLGTEVVRLGLNVGKKELKPNDVKRNNVLSKLTVYIDSINMKYDSIGLIT